jgi:hypothetical protein
MHSSSNARLAPFNVYEGWKFQIITTIVATAYVRGINVKEN